MNKILIIGSLGYLGSKLYLLLENKFDVTGIDNHYFSNAIFSNADLNNKIEKKDIRDVKDEYLKEFDVIILLAGISNDPLNKIHPEKTYLPSLNYTIRIADICKENSIKLIFPSSCSIYGYSNDIVNENSKINPLTDYSKNKADIEKYLISISDKNFRPIILRFATIYGLSPRIRFDVVINMLCGMAISKDKIILNSDGNSWRPHLHIDDALKAIEYSIKLEKFEYENMIFNVGRNEDNFKIIDIAKIISKKLNCDIDFVGNTKIENLDFIKDRKIINNKDERSYRVNFNKISSTYKDFNFKWDVNSGINNLIDELIKKNIDQDFFLKRDFYRLQHLEFLLEKGILNEDLSYIV